MLATLGLRHRVMIIVHSFHSPFPHTPSLRDVETWRGEREIGCLPLSIDRRLASLAAQSRKYERGMKSPGGFFLHSNNREKCYCFFVSWSPLGIAGAELATETAACSMHY